MSTKPPHIGSERRARRWVVLVVAAGIACSSTPARADAESDRTLAETLFREGKRLMSEENYAAACAELSESQRLDPGGGTLLLLGVCHEKQGRTATAWGELREAAALAAKEGQTARGEVAERHAAALEPRLSHLTIKVPPATAQMAGFELLRDGAPFSSAAWGLAVPVDPGPHTIEARASGKKAWATTIAIKETDKTTIEVGPLVATPEAIRAPEKAIALSAPSQPLQSRAAPARLPDARRPVGYAVGGAGVLLAGAGAAFGISALIKEGQVERACPGGVCSDAAGVQKNQSAKDSADAATVCLIAGGVALGVGVYLVLSGKTPSQRGKSAAQLAFSLASVGHGGQGAFSALW